jgi:hypothetical protein
MQFAFSPGVQVGSDKVIKMPAAECSFGNKKEEARCRTHYLQTKSSNYLEINMKHIETHDSLDCRIEPFFYLATGVIIIV